MLTEENSLAKKAFNYLLRNKVSPLLIYGEGDTLGYALRLVEGVLGKKAHHPDLFRFMPQGKMNLFVMSELQVFVREAALAPYEADHKIFIFEQAERMLPVHSNLLLKTLEESGEKVMIILVTSRKEELLDTIISRCIQVPLEEDRDFDMSEEEVFLISSCFKALIEEKYYVLSVATDKVCEYFKDVDRIYKLILLFYSERAKGSFSVFPESLVRAPISFIPFERLMDQMESAREDQKVNIRLKHSLENLFLRLRDE